MTKRDARPEGSTGTSRRWAGGSAPTCSRSLRGMAITERRLPAQHVEVDHVPQGRADDVLPGGDPLGLRAEQSRQARADAAPGRPPAVRRLQHVRDGLPGQGDRDRGRLRSRRRRAPEIPRALRDRLFALRVLRTLRRGLSRGRDPHGEGSARPAALRPRADVDRDGGTPDLEPAKRRRQALPRRRRAARRRRATDDRIAARQPRHAADLRVRRRRRSSAPR